MHIICREHYYSIALVCVCVCMCVCVWYLVQNDLKQCKIYLAFYRTCLLLLCSLFLLFFWTLKEFIAQFRGIEQIMSYLFQLSMCLSVIYAIIFDELWFDGDGKGTVQLTSFQTFCLMCDCFIYVNNSRLIHSWSLTQDCYHSVLMQIENNKQLSQQMFQFHCNNFQLTPNWSDRGKTA